jgi:hypothetical protein
MRHRAAVGLVRGADHHQHHRTPQPRLQVRQVRRPGPPLVPIRTQLRLHDHRQHRRPGRIGQRDHRIRPILRRLIIGQVIRGQPRLRMLGNRIPQHTSQQLHHQPRPSPKQLHHRLMQTRRRHDPHTSHTHRQNRETSSREPTATLESHPRLGFHAVTVGIPSAALACRSLLRRPLRRGRLRPARRPLSGVWHGVLIQNGFIVNAVPPTLRKKGGAGRRRGRPAMRLLG